MKLVSCNRSVGFVCVLISKPQMAGAAHQCSGCVTILIVMKVGMDILCAEERVHRQLLFPEQLLRVLGVFHGCICFCCADLEYSFRLPSLLVLLPWDHVILEVSYILSL